MAALNHDDDVPSAEHFWKYVAEFTAPNTTVSKWGQHQVIDFWWNACEATLEYLIGADAHRLHRNAPAPKPWLWPPSEKEHA